MKLSEKFHNMYSKLYSRGANNQIFNRIIDKLEYNIDDFDCNRISEIPDSSESEGLLITKVCVKLTEEELYKLYDVLVIEKLLRRYLTNANIKVSNINIERNNLYLVTTITSIQTLDKESIENG